MSGLVVLTFTPPKEVRSDIGLVPMHERESLGGKHGDRHLSHQRIAARRPRSRADALELTALIALREVETTELSPGDLSDDEVATLDHALERDSCVGLSALRDVGQRSGQREAEPSGKLTALGVYDDRIIKGRRILPTP